MRRALLLLLAAAPLAATACGGGGGGGGGLPKPLARATHDRRDDRSGPKIHFVYAVPGGRPELDRRRDVDRTLTNSIILLDLWFRSQKRSPRLRIDTYRGRPDITFVRLPRENFAYDRAGPDALMRDVSRVIAPRPRKLYAVYYDGAPVESEPGICGLGRPGRHPFALVFLAQSCGYDYGTAADGGYNPLVFVMAHEVVHELGFVSGCAPHSVGGGHVGDSRRDLMAPRLKPFTIPVLDVHGDDYYLAHNGCSDIGRSPYLTLP